MQLFTSICETIVNEFLVRSVRKGSLTFYIPSRKPQQQRTVIFGETADVASAYGRPVATITINNVQSFYARVATCADIGFAEAFMFGDFDVDNADQLTSIFLILILNRDNNTLSASSLIVSWLGALLNKVVHVWNRNTVTGAKRNIAAHYDLSNQLFETFLGKTWVYSCAYFGPHDIHEASASSLDAAQYAKLDMLLEKAKVQSGMHVLDIGCGWGELAIRAAQIRRCRVTGITLSHEQYTLATRRAAEAGVEHLVQFELADYRQLRLKGVMYDRIISIEMMEAIGHEFLGDYFAVLESVLKADGLVVVQVITTPEGRYEVYRHSTDFIQKHIFPGGICPSLEAIVRAMAEGSNLCVESIENIAPHYATTLKEWRRRFVQSVKEGRVSEAGFNEQFIRKWTYYFCYCEAGFATRTLGTLQIVLSRPRNVVTLGGAPQLAAKL